MLNIENYLIADMMMTTLNYQGSVQNGEFIRMENGVEAKGQGWQITPCLFEPKIIGF